jgi:hypothetical protein
MKLEEYAKTIQAHYMANQIKNLSFFTDDVVEEITGIRKVRDVYLVEFDKSRGRVIGKELYHAVLSLVRKYRKQFSDPDNRIVWGEDTDRNGIYNFDYHMSSIEKLTDFEENNYYPEPTDDIKQFTENYFEIKNQELKSKYIRQCLELIEASVQKKKDEFNSRNIFDCWYSTEKDTFTN